MTYDNFTNAELRAKLAYHNDRITGMLAEVDDFQVQLDAVTHSIEVRNEFIHEHDKRKALVRDEIRRRRTTGWLDVLDDEPRVTGIQPPPWGDVNPLVDTLEERVE